MTFGLEVSDDGLDGGPAAQLGLDEAEDTALLLSSMRSQDTQSNPIAC